MFQFPYGTKGGAQFFAKMKAGGGGGAKKKAAGQ